MKNYVFRLSKLNKLREPVDKNNTSPSKTEITHDTTLRENSSTSFIGKTRSYRNSPVKQNKDNVQQSIMNIRKNVFEKLIRKIRHLGKSVHRLAKQSLDNNLPSFDQYNFYQLRLPHYQMDIKNEVSMKVNCSISLLFKTKSCAEYSQ